MRSTTEAEGKRACDGGKVRKSGMERGGASEWEEEKARETWGDERH